jgi:hypothetical protein
VSIVAREHQVIIDPLNGMEVNRVWAHSGIGMPSPDNYTVHEVGNLREGADEFMHRNYVHNGAPPGAVSYQLVTGNEATIQLVYMNEPAWHAGSYEGNYNSIGHEHIQVGDFELTLAHGAWAIAQVYTNPDRFAYNPQIPRGRDLHPSNIRATLGQHAWHMSKNCPQFIRDQGLWDDLVDAVVVEATKVYSSASKYVKPALPENYQALLRAGEDFSFNGTDWKFVKTMVTPRRRIIFRAWYQGPESREADESGDSFNAYYVGRPSNDSSKTALILTRNGHRVIASAASPYLGSLV